VSYLVLHYFIVNSSVLLCIAQRSVYCIVLYHISMSDSAVVNYSVVNYSVVNYSVVNCTQSYCIT
jgi:hypothetical protein